MWTCADAIVDYLLFSKQYILKCEEKYGIDAVEELLDSCHALMNYGVDRYKHPAKLSLQEEKARQHSREQYLQSQINELWRTIPINEAEEKSKKERRFPEEPQENILYFIEKNSPLLKPWQREIIRIVRKIAQYFYPQRQTKVMNEGWASFWHYTLLNDLYNDGLVNDEFMLEVIKNHTDVVYQPDFDSPYFSGLNPYTLGYHMIQDIRRICENPSEEDKRWFPHLIHTDWVKSLDFAMRNFKDESFIAQYLSPHLIRELKLFCMLDDDQEEQLVVSSIHNEQGYQKIRSSLSKQYNLSQMEPNIQVYQVDIQGDRSLTLRHMQHDRRPLGKSTKSVLKHLYQLWKFPVYLESVDSDGEIIERHRCPEEKEKD